MPLPVVPTESADERQHRTIISTVLNELVKQYPQHGSWTAVVRGSGTAGTYEIATQRCRYTRIGRRVFLDVGIIFAGAITGGGTGDLNITGAPYSKAANTLPIGSVRLSGIDMVTTGASVILTFNSLGSAVSTLQINETVDNAAPNTVQISGVAANDQIFGSICYETDDP